MSTRNQYRLARGTKSQHAQDRGTIPFVVRLPITLHQFLSTQSQITHTPRAVLVRGWIEAQRRKVTKQLEGRDE